MSITAYWKTMIVAFSILICVILTGTALFEFLEPEWSLVDSTYFTTSSVFTVGYGDLVVSPNHRTITSFFLIAACTLALAASSAIGNSFISIMQHKALIRKNKKLMIKVQNALLEAKKGGLPDEEIRCLRTSLENSNEEANEKPEK